MPKSILDVGCGEGFTLKHIADNYKDAKLTGVDHNTSALAICSDVLFDIKNTECIFGDIYGLELPSKSYEFVICSEVLEHLEKPKEAAKELSRICKGKLFLSVPFEPYFRLGNLMFMNHIKDLGNAPGHINHYNRNSFTNLVADFFIRFDLMVSFPWLIIYGEPK